MPTTTTTTTVLLNLHPQSDALHRVLSVCHRRCLQIRALSFAESSVELTVTGEAARTAVLDRWLAALVDVLDVTIAAPSSGGTSPVAGKQRRDPPTSQSLA
jgi:acetolactate synthase regulatory subunit